jgi:hypothetical protein
MQSTSKRKMNPNNTRVSAVAYIGLLLSLAASPWAEAFTAPASSIRTSIPTITTTRGLPRNPFQAPPTEDSRAQQSQLYVRNPMVSSFTAIHACIEQPPPRTYKGLERNGMYTHYLSSFFHGAFVSSIPIYCLLLMLYLYDTITLVHHTESSCKPNGKH